MKKNIDIFLSVIDNYGDIGFACELILWLEQNFPREFSYSLWTDDIEKTNSFFHHNRYLLPKVSLFQRKEFQNHRTNPPLCITLFHTDFPEILLLPKWSLVLRIDYLSFDPTWVKHHWSYHIASTDACVVREIIPSPLEWWWGIFQIWAWWESRSSIADRFGIDRDRTWVSIFCYPETLVQCIDLSLIPDTCEVILLGLSALKEKFWGYKNVHFLPFLDMVTFQSVLKHSLWSIVRWEVSLMNILALGKPFFWDMYKEIWWFYAQQSEHFLDHIGTNESYKNVHMRLNQRGSGLITLAECESLLFGFENKERFGMQNKHHSLIHEIKKYIDSFHFSL